MGGWRLYNLTWGVIATPHGVGDSFLSMVAPFTLPWEMEKSRSPQLWTVGEVTTNAEPIGHTLTIGHTPTVNPTAPVEPSGGFCAYKKPPWDTRGTWPTERSCHGHEACGSDFTATCSRG